MRSVIPKQSGEVLAMGALVVVQEVQEVQEVQAVQAVQAVQEVQVVGAVEAVQVGQEPVVLRVVEDLNAVSNQRSPGKETSTAASLGKTASTLPLSTSQIKTLRSSSRCKSTPGSSLKLHRLT